MSVIDALQREQALDTRRSFIVQAPAGSGKTGVLTQRILKLLTQVERPEQILAITFTKKAAAEMRTRVAEALHQASTGEAPQDAHEKTYFDLATAALARDKEKGWNLLQNLGRLRLQTIDSLCSSLVKENLLTAELGVQFGVEDDASELYLEATRNLLASLDEDESEGEGEDVARALFTVLQQFENQFGRVQGLIVQMLEQRDHWLRDVQNVQSDWQGFQALLAESLQAINQDAEQNLLQMLPPGAKAELDKLITYAINNIHLKNPGHPLCSCTPGSLIFRKLQFQLFLTKDLEWRRQLNINVGFPPANQGLEEKEYKQRAEELLGKFIALDQPFLEAVTEFVLAPKPDLSENEWALLKNLTLIVYYAAAHLKLVFQQQRSVDFSEVAMAALKALGDKDTPTDAMLALDERIAHILVDEFQDTSFSQIELLEKLTQGWTPDDGRTLFLVGDPMQSIYAFRKADVGLFLRLWHARRLGDVMLDILQLNMNFRSSEVVLNWVNTTFSTIFPSHPDIRRGAVQYAASYPAKKQKDGDLAQAHFFIGTDAQQLAQAEAKWMVETIEKLPVEHTVAILVKGKSHVIQIAAALRKNNIAFQAVDIESLSDNQIILDLLSLLQVCVEPGNRIAWFALLRGPWCGLTLLELEKVAEANPHPWLALQKLCEDDSLLETFTRHKIQHIHTVIGRHYQQRLQQPFAEALRELALQIGLVATAQSQADVEAVELFFDLLADIPTIGGYPDDKVLEKKLAKLFVPPEPLVASQRNVKIMTMHKSKGLEFDVVFLPQLQRKGRNDDKPLILVDKQTALQQEHQELFLAPATPKKGDGNSVYEYFWNIRTQRAKHEAVRLLYVACTRARKQLYLSGSLIKTDKGIGKPVSPSLLSTIYSVLEPQAKPHEIDEQDINPIPATFRRPIQILSSKQTQHSATIQAITDAPAANNDEMDQLNIHRAAGTLLHKMLEVWARHPVNIPASIPPSQKQQWQHHLQQQGLDHEECSQGAEWIFRALENLLNNPERRRWLLETRHQDAHAEYALSSMGEQGVQHWIIDRTFIDNGVRHIIDYKLAEPTGDLEHFLTEETERYRPQLKNYRDILIERDRIPCRTYLYFPLIDHLQEVET